MADLQAALVGAVAGLFGAYTGQGCLHELEGPGPLSGLLVEAWSLREGLNRVWELHVSALSTHADLDIDAMTSRRVTLHTALADGSRVSRSGVVTRACADDADGGFARYRLMVEPWLGLLACTRRSQVWQDRSLVQIVESVFGAYPGSAAWTWAPCTVAHLRDSPFADAQGLRSYTVQYRETDLAFVSRLLAEEGLVWRFEADDSAPAGQRLVILADTADAASTPEDVTSAAPLGGRGIRYHRADSAEEQDSIQAFGGVRSLPAAVQTTLGWDPICKRALGASVPTPYAFAGRNAPRLEAYDATSAGTYATPAHAQRAAELCAQALEARHKSWLGRGTVRTFTAGTRFELTASDLDLLADLQPGRADDRAGTTFLLLEVVHAGINKLPQRLADAALQGLGVAGAELLQPWVDAEVRAQASATGYANAFVATRAGVPWRMVLADDTGARIRPKPKAPPMLSATVVGPDGRSQASGADEIHTDRLGRVRIRYEFQRGRQGPGTSAASTWVRVLQPMAGSGMGLQFIPRIGHEVLVAFHDDDIDRPVITGSVYNGRGEGGVPRTPGGQAGQADAGAFARSTDHRPAAQGNLAGGNSPAWHGASPGPVGDGGQNNAAALSGVKSKEFGGEGWNQLVFDDSDGQLRTQLATTQHATQLNLGHLVHQADNHRGSFRGVGFELRTDAYGAVRAAQGVLLSTWGAHPQEPAGDNAAGMALQRQWQTLVAGLCQAAVAHEIGPLAEHAGSAAAGQSAVSERQPPAQAMHTVLKGMVDEAAFEQALADAGAKNTTTGADKLPQFTDPVVEIAARAGLAQVAGMDVQWSAGEGIAIGSGQDTQIATGGAARIHSGQAIGMLAGAMRPGEQAAGKGFTLIAAQGDIDIQAQVGQAQVAARGAVSIQSQQGHVDWAAARRIVLQTAGGASVTLEGGNIRVECPGKVLVRASVKSFVGPERVAYPLPQMPRHLCTTCLLQAQASGSPVAALV